MATHSTCTYIRVTDSERTCRCYSEGWTKTKLIAAGLFSHHKKTLNRLKQEYRNNAPQRSFHDFRVRRVVVMLLLLVSIEHRVLAGQVAVTGAAAAAAAAVTAHGMGDPGRRRRRGGRQVVLPPRRRERRRRGGGGGQQVGPAAGEDAAAAAAAPVAVPVEELRRPLLALLLSLKHLLAEPEREFDRS